MASPNKEKNEMPVFPVGPAGKRELRRALVRSTDPARTIEQFQTANSLHSMLARSFGTTPRHEYRGTRAAQASQTVESLDTDSVMTFLWHLGVSQHEVHKRTSDTLLKELEQEIRKAKSKESLLELLKSCWVYATSMPELRNVLWAVLRALGSDTPLPVLTALAERGEDGSLKHQEIFDPLPPLLKRLCWEADWEARVPIEPDAEAGDYLKLVQSTLLYETIAPLLQQYTTHPQLVDAANRPFVATIRERRVLTKQRRALTTAASQSVARSTGAGGILKSPTTPAAANPIGDESSTGKAVSSLRSLLCDTVGTASTFRPKLLYALLQILMAEHCVLKQDSVAGSERLHCTLVGDILLSAGGPLPKAYHYVLTLARVLDDCVQEGNITNLSLSRIQAALREIFQPDDEGVVVPASKPESTPVSSQDSSSNAMKRQLNRIITAGLAAMKDADPQNLFLNPVTDAIAPGYSKIISKPMSIVTMERKVKNNEYSNISEWETDVKLVFKNCIDYNRGNAGQWFRGEAQRQGKVFREEIFPQARRLYQTEVAKRSVEDQNERKRKPEDGPEINPLPASTKKRKKEKEEYLPSMPALAAMLLADPFFVRIVAARTLRELRRGVMNGMSVPAAHNVVPSLLQLLHMARWSKELAAVRGKRYFVPDGGIQNCTNEENPAAYVPYATLRRYMPLLLRLLLESELDRRVAVGGDLYDAAQSADLSPPPLPASAWQGGQQLEVASGLVEGALIFVCQPGMANEASLSVTFPKFAQALEGLSDGLCQNQGFFLCLIQVLLRHKAKLGKPTRDAIVKSWLSWLKNSSTKGSSVVSSAHEYLMRLLVEWSAFGNQVLPRDDLMHVSWDVVKAVDSTASKGETFIQQWQAETRAFAVIKRQYERMLKFLPTSQAEQWKQEVGLGEGEQREEIVKLDESGETS